PVAAVVCSPGPAGTAVIRRALGRGHSRGVLLSTATQLRGQAVCLRLADGVAATDAGAELAADSPAAQPGAVDAADTRRAERFLSGYLHRRCGQSGLATGSATNRHDNADALRRLQSDAIGHVRGRVWRHWPDAGGGGERADERLLGRVVSSCSTRAVA